jgi:hypothetical protein
MTFLTFNHQLGYDYSVHLDPTTHSLSIDWAVDFSIYNIGSSSIVLTNVSTLFTSNDHGFHSAQLAMTWLENAGIVLSTDTGFSQALDLKWDAHSRDISRDCYHPIANVTPRLGIVNFQLTAQRAHSTDVVPLYLNNNDGNGSRTTRLPIEDTSEIGPYSISLAFNTK